MLLLNPRLLAVLGLTVGGALLAYQAAPDAQVKEWKVTRRTDEAVRHRILKQSELERAAAAQREGFAAITAGPAVDPAPPKTPLTVESLVAEVKRVSAGAPEWVPTVPLMGRLASAMLAHDPAFITFADLPRGVGGRFYYGPGTQPKIVLSNDLKRLHDKGVPVALIAPVLAHELDHFFLYMTRDLMRTRRSKAEISAATSEGAYLEVLMRGGFSGPRGAGGGGDPVDGRRPEDDEVQGYYRYLKKLRASLFAGDVKGLVHEHYGPDPKEGK